MRQSSREAFGLTKYFSKDLGKIKPGQTIDKSVKVYNDGDKPVKLAYATSSVPGCVAKVPNAAIPPGGSLQLPVQIRPGDKWSSSGSISISVRTGVPSQPTLQVSVNYETRVQ
jgi:hypothetical protein